MSVYHFSILTVFALFLVGCPAAETAQQAQLEPFFDLEGFLNAEVERLAADRVVVDKTIVLDGKTETKRLDQLNMAEELKLLRNSDINRPAWMDRYRIDSTFSAQGPLQQVTYTATDDDLRTRHLMVTFSGDQQVTAIEVLNDSETFLSSGITRINYQPSSGLTLESQQAIRGGTATDLRIELKFVDN